MCVVISHVYAISFMPKRHFNASCSPRMSLRALVGQILFQVFTILFNTSRVLTDQKASFAGRMWMTRIRTRTHTHTRLYLDGGYAAKTPRCQSIQWPYNNIQCCIVKNNDSGLLVLIGFTSECNANTCMWCDQASIPRMYSRQSLGWPSLTYSMYWHSCMDMYTCVCVHALV